ncbi:hypothetical protein U0070_026028 [Myodes glareolus]|uniref:ATP synthase peripheral stalk subunit F6, mitochondrial n=1 Tax=Myodes glareolus TaxID=447135 RepID=A0AAW0HBU9_MYOGA
MVLPCRMWKDVLCSCAHDFCSTFANVNTKFRAARVTTDLVQKLFVDKIREYTSKQQTSGGPVDAGPEYQQELDRELFKLKQMFDKGDMNMFPTFKFEDPKFEVFDKPQS